MAVQVSFRTSGVAAHAFGASCSVSTLYAMLRDHECGDLIRSGRLARSSLRPLGFLLSLAGADPMADSKAVSPDSVVSRDPEIHSGDLVFAGTRVPVDTLVDYLKAGRSIDDFLEGFPTVERWQVEAFLELSPEGVDHLRTHDPRAA
jgi:uncharacterized protein (DUF433 family)